MLEKYTDIEISTDAATFEFDSIGPKGRIRKIVIYTRYEFGNYFSPGFGDKNPDTGEFDDLVVTNNGDSAKILATVASIANIYRQTPPRRDNRCRKHKGANKIVSYQHC